MYVTVKIRGFKGIKLIREAKPELQIYTDYTDVCLKFENPFDLLLFYQFLKKVIEGNDKD